MAVTGGAHAGTYSYTYDALNRLTQVVYPGPATDTYTYDSVGNRLTKNTTSYTYDAANELTAMGGVSYGYDANGNRTGKGTDTFSYDHEDRMTQSVVGGTTTAYAYNGDGLRMSKTTAGVTTRYTWDGVQVRHLNRDQSPGVAEAPWLHNACPCIQNNPIYPIDHKRVIPLVAACA